VVILATKPEEVEAQVTVMVGLLFKALLMKAR
jgi:hypothetical protein